MTRRGPASGTTRPAFPALDREESLAGGDEQAGLPAHPPESACITHTSPFAGTGSLSRVRSVI